MNSDRGSASTADGSRTGRWLLRLLAVILLATWALAFFSTVNSALIPPMYLYVFSAVYTVVVLIVVWWLLRIGNSPRLWKKTLAVILVLALVVFHIALVRSASRTGELLQGLEQPASSRTGYVIVGQEGERINLEDADNIGILGDDLAQPGLVEALRQRTPAKPRTVGSLAELVREVKKGEIPLAVLRASAFEVLGDSLPETDRGLGVIESVSVESAAPPMVEAESSEPFVLYLSGLDTYGEIQDSGRSDVNMLAVVNPKTKKLLLVNTPRDYFVQLDGTSGARDKLTHAGIYGIDVARRTMEDLYGVEVPYYARVNFTSLLELIDIIGPINVYAEQSFGDFKEGMNVLDGEAALEFSRTRYDFEDGDRERGRNQQRVIAAIVMNLSSPRNALKLTRALDHMQGSFETNLSESSMRELFREQANSGGSWEIENFAVEGTDAEDYTYSMPDVPLYVMIPDQESVDDARGRILRDLNRQGEPGRTARAQ
ncbi:LCP family protein [Corynebacterium pacaense]|uniref:LCP family protein n=1 Tax=Corynebacterium pacaense TaxID=1816684 RepID=UPI0009BBC58A|nr:LCP family protein [Corynebacterium pacaense]